MKKIINGVRYDTEKMILIGEATSPGFYVSDFQFWSAGLYKSKRSDRYCLAGEGGPMSRFARPAGVSGMTGGADLTPMSKEEALEWAEQFLDAELVEEFFGDMVEEA